MDNGGYKFIYVSPNYQIMDEKDYFAVLKNYKQIAAFKDKDMAFDFVRNFLCDTFEV